MELAATGRSVGVEGFEELDIRCDNEPRIPVLGGEARGRGLVVVKIRVVFEDDIHIRVEG